MIRLPLQRACTFVLILVGASCHPALTSLPAVVANDNTLPAGTLHADTLTLSLVTRRARWSPEADSGPSVEVVAFAEAGETPRIPAPLIRVKEGTVIDITIANIGSDSTLNIVGLTTRPDQAHDTLRIPAGDTRHLRFPAGAPGTYLYWAVMGKHVPDVDAERETLAGAFIVDPRAGSPPDRVLVMNIWGVIKDPVTYGNALAINGRSWPYTERISATVGDTLRWRVINATIRNHPMHLHGFYFTVASRGDPYADTVYAPALRETMVTELMRPGSSMTLTAVVDRPGRWLFHCHIAFHVIPASARLNTDSTEAAHNAMSTDAGRHMAGLVLGIDVRARPGSVAADRRGARRLELFVDEGRRRHRSPRTLGYVLQRGATPPAADSVEPMGTTLFLTRDQPTDVVVHNRLPMATAVHWHGIELESYSDGVAGWSGDSTRMAPMIPPGDSFVAHLTLPRAGTFIYHTHLGDFEQLTSGLYGALIVTEPGERFDPARDHVYLLAWDGVADPPYILVNGDSTSAPLTVQAGVSQRFRIIAIGAAGGQGVALRRDTTLVTWRALAKDGWTLPRAQATLRPAAQRVATGETFDFEFIPSPGEYLLTANFDRTRPPWRQRIIAR